MSSSEEEVVASREQVARPQPGTAYNAQPSGIGVSIEMEMAGMREWDRRMKAGERHWPDMLGAVYRAMHAVALASPPITDREG